MPKKMNSETPKEQSKRFKKDAQKLIDDGELSPIDAGEGLERLLGSISQKPH